MFSFRFRVHECILGEDSVNNMLRAERKRAGEGEKRERAREREREREYVYA